MITIILILVAAFLLMAVGLSMTMTYGWSSGKVPTDAIGIGNNLRMGPFVVSGTLLPGEFVEFNDATSVKRLASRGYVIGVADVNGTAQSRKLSKMTTAFGANDPVTVIYAGYVVMECDSVVGTTRSSLAKSGTTEIYHVETIGAGVFAHVAGRCMKTNNAGEKTVILLGHS